MRLILLFFSFSLSFFAYAQTPGMNAPDRKVKLSGTVLDEMETPISYASVSLYAWPDSTLLKGAATDEQGKFSFTLNSGLYALKVNFLSYKETWITNIKLEKENLNLGEIVLESDATVLEEVEVRAEKSTMEMKLDKRVFNVGKDLSNTGGNATDILENIPSVAVDIDGNVSLRGSEGVRILINGKPSGLIGTNPGEALRQLQGNLIERIEVITNPSARYDAQGEVGIINIVLKKEQDKGINGSFDVGIGYPHNHNAAYNLNYRKDWINLFSSYSIQYRENPGYGSSLQEYNDSDTSFVFRSDREHTRSEFGNTFRAGADFFLDPKNTLTFAGLYNWSQGDNIATINYEDLDGTGTLIQKVVRDNDELETEENIEFELNHQMKFPQEDRKWSSQFQWVKADDLEEAEITEEILFGDEGLIEQQSRNTENEKNILFQSDYIHPFNENGKFEAGIKATFRTVENEYLVEELNEENEWVILPRFNDHFIYQENIYAAYVMVGDEYETFSWQVGLRTEYTDIRTELLISNRKNNRDYLNLFPSAHLSYNLDEENALQLSYSRRLNRPWFRLLLPFSNYSDSRSFWSGNPDLDPEYSDSYELGYLKYFKKGSILTSAYYRYRTGVIDRITNIDSAGFALRLPVNLSTQDAFGLEFNVNYDLSSWWRLNGNANFYRAITSGSYEGQTLDADTYTWNMRINSKWTIMDNVDVQVSFDYRGPENTTQGKRKAMYDVDLGASMDILNDKGTLTLSGRNIFNTRIRRSIIQTENYYAESEFQWRRGQIVLSFNYRLNQNKKSGRGQGSNGQRF